MARAAKVLAFPTTKITFKADDFHGVELLAKYDANRTYVVFCQRFLECSPQQLKEKAATIDITAGVDAVEHMINDFRTLAIRIRSAEPSVHECRRSPHRSPTRIGLSRGAVRLGLARRVNARQ